MSLRTFLAIAAAALAPSIGVSQEWPSKPIRVVIPFAAGSVSEAIFRTMIPGVEADLGQRFIVEAKPGADRSEEHTSELQSLRHLVCRLLLEKKKNKQ